MEKSIFMLNPRFIEQVRIKDPKSSLVQIIVNAPTDPFPRIFEGEFKSKEQALSELNKIVEYIQKNTMIDLVKFMEGVEQ